MAALEYLEERDPMAAVALDDAVIQTLERLAKFPHLGRVGLVPGTREVVIGKYILVYEVGDKQIEIVYFYHGSMLYPPVQDD